jgi:hypothetical protein
MRAATAENVQGSVGETPQIWLDIKRVKARPAANPATVPVAIRASPFFSTIRRTWFCCAPSPPQRESYAHQWVADHVGTNWTTSPGASWEKLRPLRTLGAVEAPSRTSIRRNSLDSVGAWSYTFLMGGNPYLIGKIRFVRYPAGISIRTCGLVQLVSLSGRVDSQQMSDIQCI